LRKKTLERVLSDYTNSENAVAAISGTRPVMRSGGSHSSKVFRHKNPAKSDYRLATIEYDATVVRRLDTGVALPP
jgi:hypothetical protein